MIKFNIVQFLYYISPVTKKYIIFSAKFTPKKKKKKKKTG